MLKDTNIPMKKLMNRPKLAELTHARVDYLLSNITTVVHRYGARKISQMTMSILASVFLETIIHQAVFFFFLFSSAG